MEIATKPPKIIVAIDFGTTFSGFAYALTSQPEDIWKHYAWPDLGAGGGDNYCKTRTSLLYSKDEVSRSCSLDSWGYSAIWNYATKGGAGRSPCGHQMDSKGYVFVDKFKLLLANEGRHTASVSLPEGLVLQDVISDYLLKLGELIMNVLRENLGNHVQKQDTQWLITVPAIWDERAKQKMKRCVELAGLVRGPACKDQTASKHTLMFVLEPEAAAVYCQEKGGCHLTKGDQFLVVDVGGGTTDLVLHEKIRSGEILEVKEISPSSGDLCGGIFLDEHFLKFLSRKIDCFERYRINQPTSVLRLLGQWQILKHGFDGTARLDYTLQLPAKLAREWEANQIKFAPDARSTYDTLHLSLKDMLDIFNPVVEKILRLIEIKVNKRKRSTVKSIMMVGGFSDSPYLQKRVRAAFSHKATVTIPKEPGSAICCGAVTYGVHGANLITSRIVKKTYGSNICRRFQPGDPLNFQFKDDDGDLFCDNIFEDYVSAGDKIRLHHRTTHSYYPVFKNQTECRIDLLSCSKSPKPKFVTDSRVEKLGSFIVTHPSAKALGKTPHFKVFTYFGKSMIEVTAEGVNFGKGKKFGMPPVLFETA